LKVVISSRYQQLEDTNFILKTSCFLIQTYKRLFLWNFRYLIISLSENMTAVS